MKNLKVNIFNLIPWLFITSLLFGQMVRIPLFGRYIYPHDIMLGVCLIVGSIFHKRQKKYVPKKIFLIFVFFVLIALLSIIIQIQINGSNAAFIGIMYLIRFVYYVIGGWLLVRFYITFHWVRSLYITGTIFSIIGLVQYVLYPDLRNLLYLGWDPHYYRLFSTFFDPNFAGIIIVCTILIGLRYLLVKWSWLVILTMIVNSIALALTFSRSSYLAMIVGGLLFVIFSKRRKLAYGLFLVLFAVCLLFLFAFHSSFFSITRYNSGIARVNNWMASFHLIQMSPLLGHGWYMLNNPDNETHAFSYLDNSFLFVTATTGIIGMSVFIWFIVTIIQRVLKKREEKNIVFFAVVISTFAAVGIHSQFVNSLLYPWVILWLAILTSRFIFCT